MLTAPCLSNGDNLSEQQGGAAAGSVDSDSN